MIKNIKRASVGSVFEVWSSDKGTKVDLPKWVAKAKHELIESIEEYESWLEEQLNSRIKRLDKVDEGIRKTVIHLMDDNLRGAYNRNGWTTDEIVNALKKSMFV